MTLFEKIYWTSLVVTTILAAFFAITDPDEKKEVSERMELPFAVQLFGTFNYLIVKFLLWLWGVSIDLFPSLPVL